MLSSNLPVASNWRILGASVTGTSHHKAGRDCDDAHAIRQLQDGPLLLAVADGAGSVSHAAAGAKCAVRTALDTAEAALAQQPEDMEQWQRLLDLVLASVRMSLEQLASGEMSFPGIEHEQSQTAEAAEDSFMVGVPLAGTLALPLYEFATTLLVAIVTPQWLAVTQIGDGAVVAQYADGNLEALTWPDHGEYVNETSFITNANYGQHIQYCILSEKDLLGIALFTDGIERLVLNFATKTPGKSFFTSMFQFVARAEASEGELAAFLASERVCELTDDDKTLVLAVRNMRQAGATFGDV